MTDEEKINKTIDLIIHYGGIEGDHHKAWVLDQILRILMNEQDYLNLIKELEENGYWYDEGIPP